MFNKFDFKWHTCCKTGNLSHAVLVLDIEATGPFFFVQLFAWAELIELSALCLFVLRSLHCGATMQQPVAAIGACWHTKCVDVLEHHCLAYRAAVHGQPNAAQIRVRIPLMKVNPLRESALNVLHVLGQLHVIAFPFTLVRCRTRALMMIGSERLRDDTHGVYAI